MKTVHTEALHAFDFLVGEWTVRHRRLDKRLAGCTEWSEFNGRSRLRQLIGGYANLDENVIELPQGTYEAFTVRLFDPERGVWSIYWVDGRNPAKMEPPVVGGFKDGVGIFSGDDTFEGRPIRVRFIWSRITRDSARWEQAFSVDGEKTWETNWEMDFTRAAGRN